MRVNWPLVALLTVLGVGLPVLASADPSNEDLERNRRLLERWRGDPAHYARLQEDLRAFSRMSPERQEKMRTLDRELHEADSGTQKRLLNVLERYVGWLERLPEADRARIESAPDVTARLQEIRELRDAEYLERQPKKERDRLALLPPVERREELKRLRREERSRREEWREVVKNQPPTDKPPPPPAAKPMRLRDFPGDVQVFVNVMLKPQLSVEERDLLKKAEESPAPSLARTIMELSVKHPVVLPGAVGATHYKELPFEIREKLVLKELTQQQRNRLINGGSVGKWPDFALEVNAIARDRKIDLPRQLGPSHPGEFPPLVASFIEKTLLPKLSTKEKAEFKFAEGSWPEYPKKLLKLAKEHGLEVPLMKLPGTKEYWDKALAALPELPNRTLQAFMEAMTKDEKAELKLSNLDPDERVQRVTEAYFKRHPRHLDQLRKIDQKLFGTN